MKKFYLAILCLFTTLLFLGSCQKLDTTSLGVGLIPVVDNVNTFDTLLSVVTDTNLLYLDSSRITKYDDHALGYMEDPEFGTTSAAVYFGLTPVSSGVHPFLNKDSIGDRIDSVVLSLSYSGLFGDSLSVENIRVSEIDQSANFSDSLVGYPITAAHFPIVPQPLGTALLNFTTLNDDRQFRQGKDTAIITQQNVVRIKLNTALGRRLVGYDTLNAYKSDSAFRTYFKGLALTIDSNGSPRKKALAYFNLSDTAKTKLTVYYRFPNNGIIDTSYATFYYNTGSSSRSANIVRRNIGGSNYAGNFGNPADNKQRLYIQSGPGSFANISIPALGTLSNRLIYKAELIMKVLPSAENNLFAVPVLFLDHIDQVNKRNVTVQNDFQVDNSGNYNYNNFGGLIKSDTAYIFNISRFVQGVVSRKLTPYKFRVYAPFQTQPYYTSADIYPASYSLLTYPFLVNSHIGRGRVVLGGGSHPTQKMRVRLVYSRI